MDMSVAAASSALATLQAMAASAAGPSATGSSGATATHSSTASTKTAPSVQADLSGGGLYALSQSVSHALSVADAAGAAGQGVLDLLRQMQQAAAQAADTGTTSTERASLDQSFQTSAGQIAPTLLSARVGGVNLVVGSQSVGLKVSLGEGAGASLPGLDLNVSGSLLKLGGAALVNADGAAAADQATTDALASAGGALAGLQTHADALAAHAGFVQAAGQAVATPGLDDGGDGARLLALQVGQQLSGQSNAIANSAPQQILSLFRA